MILFFVIFRKDRKDRSNDKERSKRPREEASEDERSRYGSRPNKMQPSHRSAYRQDQSERGTHSEHDRYGSSRFANEPHKDYGYEYKRDHYDRSDHPRSSGYHRDREHPRTDKRYKKYFDSVLFSLCKLMIFIFVDRQMQNVKEDWKYQRRDLVPPLAPRPMYYSGFVPPGAPLYPAVDPFQRDRFGPAPWRPPERDYRRDYDRRQQ